MGPNKKVSTGKLNLEEDMDPGGDQDRGRTCPRDSGSHSLGPRAGPPLLG